MLTGAERNSLALTLGFLLLGSGIKAWNRAQAEIGPFAGDAAGAEAATGPADGGPGDPAAAPSAVSESGAGSGAAPADSAGEDAAGDAKGDDGARPPVEAGAGLEGPSGANGPGRGPGKGPGSPRAGRASKRKPPPAGKVDPNRADADRLATIPGIGPKLAAAIVEDRRAAGAFRDLEQLRRVKGIGEKKWAAITPYLSLAEAPPQASAAQAGKGPEANGTSADVGR